MGSGNCPRASFLDLLLVLLDDCFIDFGALGGPWWPPAGMDAIVSKVGIGNRCRRGRSIRANAFSNYRESVVEMSRFKCGRRDRERLCCRQNFV